MRSKKYPSWIEWQEIVISHIKTAVSSTGIKGYTLSGASENLHIGVGTSDFDAKSMPYIQVTLDGIQPSWDGSGNDYIGKQYTTGSGGKVLEQRKDVEERLAFEIVIYGQQQDNIVPISQALRDYFGFKSTMSVSLHGNTHIVPTVLQNYTLDPQEDQSGKITYSMGSWTLILDITSEVFLENSLSSGAIKPDINVITTELDSRLSATGTVSTITKTI